MAIGDWHTRENGYSFKETLHGPMVWDQCVGCEKPVLVVGSGLPEDRFSGDPRCVTCWRTYHGVDNVYGRQ